MMARLAERPWLNHLPNGTIGGGANGEIPHGPWNPIQGSPGLATNDTLVGAGTNDVLRGGRGEDVLTGNAGDDRLLGGQGNDALDGGDGNDRLFGGFGNDTMVGGIGNDRLRGGRGDDALVGGAGDDILFGGVGNDTLTGGDGSDTYWFGRGGGQDTISNTDAGAESNDLLRVGPGVALDQLSFQHVGDAMVISILGSEDTITVTGWFADPNNRLDGIQLASGDVLTATQIEGLVSAMAAFAPGEIIGQPSLDLGGSIVPIAVGVGSSDLP
jgi:Ca2+-binding RTX toxin-like protein